MCIYFHIKIHSQSEMVESYTNMYEPVTHLLFADRDTIIGGDAVVNIFVAEIMAILASEALLRENKKLNPWTFDFKSNTGRERLIRTWLIRSST